MLIYTFCSIFIYTVTVTIQIVLDWAWLQENLILFHAKNISPYKPAYPDLQMSVCIWKIIFLISQNICSGYSKELSQ